MGQLREVHSQCVSGSRPGVRSLSSRRTADGRVNFGGVIKEVCLAYLPHLAIGDYALVHVGFAISQVDEQAARETLRTLEQMGILQEQLDELQQTDRLPAQGADVEIVP